MAQLAGLSYSSPFYQLLQGALGQAGFGTVQSFLLDEFWQQTMPVTKWQELYPAGEENERGLIRQFFGTNEVPVMATYTAENAEGHLIANEGFSVIQHGMPTAKLSYRYDNDSFEKGQELMAANANMTGINAKIFNSFLKSTQDLINGIHSLRSYTGLLIESTGKYVSDSTNNPGGVQGLTFDFTENVPNFSQNKKTCGSFAEEDTNYVRKGTPYAWSNQNSNPIGDLMDMAHTYEFIKHQDTTQAVFRMNDYTANLFYNNPTVKKKVYLKLHGGDTIPENIPYIDVSVQEVNNYLTLMGLPQIEVEKLRSAVYALDPVTKKLKKNLITGFKDGVVVLRAKGPVGHYDWKRVGNIAATAENPMLYTDGNMIGIQQITKTEAGEIWFNGRNKGIPVPDNIDNVLYLDIATVPVVTT